jgi:hypothetical protein
MSFGVRFAIGFVVGIVLSAFAFVFVGAGHGTYGPLIANASLLGLLPGVGSLLGFFGTPFLWGAYYAAIPRISSRPKRSAALGALALLHLAPGLWFTLGDEYFPRVFNYYRSTFFLYAAVLVAAILGVALFFGADAAEGHRTYLRREAK